MPGAIYATTQGVRWVIERVAEAERARPRFYQIASAFMLGVVFLGFAKSYFFRSAFENFPVAPIVLVHAGVMTAWFVLFFAQTSLVAARRVRVHRWLGLSSLVLAMAMIATIIPTTYGFPARRFAVEVAGYSFESDLEHITMVVHGNTAMLLLFTGLYSAGLWFRRQTAVHKRLMLLAAVAVVTPAASRLLTVVGEPGVTSEPLGIAMAFGMPLALVAHDYVVDRRIHLATVIGVGATISLLGLLGLIGKSPLGEPIIRILAGAV